MSRLKILADARDFFRNKEKTFFIPGETYIPASGKVVDEDDCSALVDASLDMWLTAGRHSDTFDRLFAKTVGVRKCKTTVSGSAANLLAFATLTSWKLGDKRIKKGDEVITVAAGFPTTVGPIIQYGCIPVFVDVDPITYNVDIQALKKALSPRTKAIVLAHTLGNPFNAVAVKEICNANELWLIEDCCDALGGSIRDSSGASRPVGTFGDLATVSFYPAHHITMGEGGAVLTDNPLLAKICESFRDWGRDCHCPPGRDNTCGKRFDWQYENLPDGYDHKYVYSHVGYNLKITDMQAALGVSQLKKLDYFINKRRKNFLRLSDNLLNLNLDEYFQLPEVVVEGAKPSWFGFLLTIRDGVKLPRKQLLASLEEKRVGTRLLFAGNITKQPGFRNEKFRVIDKLPNTDKAMNDVFWLGLWPGLDEVQLDYMAETLLLTTKTLLNKGNKCRL